MADDGLQRASGRRGTRRRAHDLALIVPILGVIALMPPLIGLFARPDTGIFGIPLIVVYLFGLWLVLILMALLVASRLKRSAHSDTP